MVSARVRGVLSGAALAALLVAACRTGESTKAVLNGGAGSRSASGGEAGRSGSGGSESGKGGADPNGGSNTIVVPDASVDASDDVVIEPDAACGIGTAEATLRPVRILVMFDRSTSMLPSMIGSITKPDRWASATSALRQFLSDPSAAGLGVALRFFPHDLPATGCTQEVCDTAACAEVLVDIGTLTAESAPADAHEAALLAAIDESIPVRTEPVQLGGTPTSVALGGATQWASADQAAHPESRTVILFVTDGAPAGCDERIAFIAGLAEEALEASGVVTFAVGLLDEEGEGLNDDFMNQIAEAGGTEAAFFIQDGPDSAQNLLAVLNEIRGRALPCDFPMPEATRTGEAIDPRLVNVTYTAGDGAETRFTKVLGGADACNASVSWYYDDEEAPSRIMLCPAACGAVATDPDARFEILVGCAPDLEPPR
jgi:hypothetical protein